jgi:hypothetical protein
MKKNDKYMDIALKLSDVAKTQRGLFDSIINSSQIFKRLDLFNSIEPLIKELDSVNILKNTLSLESFSSPILEMTRQMNLAISELSISPLLKSITDESLKISNSWKRSISSSLSLDQSTETFLLGIQSHISRISEISLLAESCLANIDFSNIGALSSISLDFKDSIKDTHFLFTESYSSLITTIAAKQSSILSYPPVVVTIPPVEFYLNNRFIEKISVTREEARGETDLIRSLAEETEDELEANLGVLDPSLIKLWKGAKEALNSHNPDATRHFVTSLRELITHVINKLSPDDEIKAWSNSLDYYHNNRPTRRGRLLFICRNINHNQFSDLLKKDIDALLAYVDVFQEGTHAIDSQLTKTQLDLLMLKAESTIRFLIRIWKDTSDA